jgi:hypothetical protein
MKIWQFAGVALAALLLGSCGLLTDPTVEGSWQWFTVGTRRSDFGSSYFAQNGTLQYYSSVEGNSRFEETLNDWVSVETPGGYGAVYNIARNGTEFVSSYGMYTRASAASAWTLLAGSRALRLQYVGLDRDENLYAAVDINSKLITPLGSTKIYVRLKGSSAWTPVSGLPTPLYIAPDSIDPIGRAFITTNTGSFQLQGSSAVALPQPQATSYDYLGNRYFVPALGNGTTIQKVTPSGTLEPWVNFGGQGTSTLLKFIGFGKDGRFYAIAGFNSTLGFDFGQYDIIAISPSNPKWSKVASSVLDGAGRRTGPANLTIAYNVSFAPDGSLYFYACENGCTPTVGNPFSYGIYRLKF